MKKILVILMILIVGVTCYSRDFFLYVNKPNTAYSDTNYPRINNAIFFINQSCNDSTYTVYLEIYDNPYMNGDIVYDDGSYCDNITVSAACNLEIFSGEDHSIIIYPDRYDMPVISLYGGGPNLRRIRNIQFHNDNTNVTDSNIGIYVKSPNTIIEDCQFITELYRKPYFNDIKLVHNDKIESVNKELFVINCLFDTNVESFDVVGELIFEPRINTFVIGDKTYPTSYTFHGLKNKFISNGVSAWITGSLNTYFNENYCIGRFYHPGLPTFWLTNSYLGSSINVIDNEIHRTGNTFRTEPKYSSTIKGNLFYRNWVNKFLFPATNTARSSKFLNNVMLTKDSDISNCGLLALIQQDTISNNTFVNLDYDSGFTPYNLVLNSNLQVHNNIFSNYINQPIEIATISEDHIVSNMFNNCANDYSDNLNIIGEPNFTSPGGLDFSLVWPCKAIGNGYSAEFDDPASPGYDIKLITYQDDTIDIGAIPFNQDRKEYKTFIAGENTKNWTGFPAIDTENYSDIVIPGHLEPVLCNHMYPMFYDLFTNNEGMDYVAYQEKLGNSLEEQHFTLAYWGSDNPHVQAYYGYKVVCNENSSSWFSGLLRDPYLPIPLYGTGDEVWLGFTVDRTTDVLIAFSDILDGIKTIKHKDWALSWTGSVWLGTGANSGNTNLELGDFVSITFRPGATLPESFQWRFVDTSDSDSFRYQDAEFVTFEEESDYIPFFIDIDENSNIEEIALYADSECIGGAKTQGETTVMVKAFMEDIPADSEISIVTFSGAKSSKKVAQILEYNSALQIWNNAKRVNKDNRDFYHISIREDHDSLLETNSIVTSNYPNPFNPETTIEFNNPVQGEVNINIYNLKGQLVKSLLQDNLTQGVHKVVWQGTDSNNRQVASGVYFYRVTNSNRGSITKKIILMK